MDYLRVLPLYSNIAKFTIPQMGQTHKILIINLKTLRNWTNASKTYLNVTKTQLVIFKQLWKHLFETNLAKYLGIKISFHGINTRPNKINATISKVRHHVDLKHSSLSIMQFANHICTILLWFGHRISTLLRLFFILKEVSKANAFFARKHSFRSPI